MSVFKDEQIAAKILKGHPLPINAGSKFKIYALAGGAIAVTALAMAAVFYKRGEAPAQAAAVFSAAPADTKITSVGVRKKLPPVIEEIRAEAVELPAHATSAVRPAITTAEVVTVSEPASNHRVADSKVAPAVPQNAAALLEEAARIEAAAKNDTAQLERSRALYQRALEAGLTGSMENNCLARLNDLTAKLILDPKTVCSEPKALFHKVEQGEVIEKIAKKFKVNQGQIKRVNHLNDRMSIRLGQNLKMLPGETVFKVNKENLTGTLYIDGVYIKRYPVGIGPGNATPKGTFVIENKLVNPDWYYEGKKMPFGDPKNILGTRWMGMANTAGGNGAGLGVHGTAFPDSVPGRESKGCVRMHNEDVEELYDFMPQGGKVVIE